MLANHAQVSAPAVGHGDTRRLRRQLAILRAGIEDLEQEWDATAELANHLYRQRAAAGRPVRVADVLADIEVVMRSSQGLPDRLPPDTGAVRLYRDIETAQASYERLLRQHLNHAAAAIEAAATPATAAGDTLS
ncbi:MAG: hypothetical protein ABI418_18400 [Jatrophihabitantaceae bacterium]